MDLISVVGAGNVHVALNDTEANAARLALNQLVADGGGSGTVLGSTSNPSGPGVDIYNFGGTPHGTDSLPAGGEALVITGNAPRTLDGNGTKEVLIGNSGGDTINATAAGDHGWIFAGDGNDSITVGDGNFNIWTGAGNDTIALGSGTDTVTAQGHATVSGGTHDLLIASGNASISVSGGNNDTFIGGSGHDSVNVVSGSSSVDFQFYASLSGSTATHDITGFAASDTIDLFNLTAAAPVVIGGNTVITLSDGSHITLNGYTGAVNINHTP